MARTVADVALLLSAIAGPDPRCPISINEPGSRFAGNLERGFKGVRVAWFKDMGGIPFDPRILKIVNAQRKVFESLGCIVEEAEPDWTGAHEGYDILRAWGFATSQGEYVRLHRDLVKDTVIWEVERGSKLSGEDIARGLALRSRAWDRMRVFQEKYEYFITPTTQVLPFDITQPYPNRDRGREDDDVRRVAEVLYPDFGAREPGSVGAVRVHRRRIAGGSADRRPASGRVECPADRARVRTGYTDQAVVNLESSEVNRYERI